MSLKSKVIEHWEENLTKAKNWSLPDIRQSSCAYCNEYYEARAPRKCYGCPIAEATGQHRCQDTPYYQVSELRREIYMYKWEDKETWIKMIKAVEAELEFLKSLPEDQEEE